MNPLISVIIPFYNARNTLGRAIRSVLEQSHTNLELLLINDGSTDDSASLLSHIQDARLRVISQANQGPSAARNNGLRHAQGEWICFVDADDTLTPNALELMLYTAAPQVDIIVGSFQTTKDVSENYASPPTAVSISPARLAQNTLFWQKYEQGIIDDVFADSPVRHPLNLGAPWAKLYRKAYLNKHGLCFNEQLVLHEDTLFNHLAYTHAREVSIISTPVYCYLDNPCSLTRSQNPRYQEHCIAALAQFHQLHPDCPEELCYFAMFRILECWRAICANTPAKLFKRYRLIKRFRRNPVIGKYAKQISLTENPYLNKFEKLELFLFKYQLFFGLIFITPVIRELRHLKHRQSMTSKSY